jgi:hypothetical protein
VSSIDAQRPSEGWPAWLLVGVVALVFLLVPLWIRYAGHATMTLPSVPLHPAVVLQGGERISFAPGDLATGDGILCQSFGLQVGAWVPKPGLSTASSLAGPASTASIHVRTRPNGVVIARCS